MNEPKPTVAQLEKRLRDIAAGARSKADLLASGSPTSIYTKPVDVLRALAKEAEEGLAPDPDAGLEIQRMLMLGTAHLPQEYFDWLQIQNRCNPAFPDLSLPTEIDPDACECGPYLVVDPISEYGYRICTSPETTELFLRNHRPEDPLAVLIRLAQAHNCDWVGVDRDGDTVDGLPVYDW